MESNFIVTKEPPEWWDNYVNWPRQTSHFCRLDNTSNYFLMGNKGLCFQILEKGPLKMAKSFFPELDEELLNTFKEYCKKNKLHPIIHSYKELPNLNYVMLATSMVDLKKDDLWMSLDKKQRNRIRRAKEKNLIFKEATSKQEWLEYYNLYKNTSIRKNIKYYPEEHLNSLFNLDRKFSKLFYAEYENKPASYAQVFVHKKVIFLNSLANTEKAYEINANAYLMWKTIEWAKEKDLELYDLGGLDEHARKNSPTDRINKFKLSFGERKDFWEYTDSFLYTRFRTIYGKIRNSFLGKLVWK